MGIVKGFPNYIKNVEKLNQNLTTFIYRGFWPGASSTSTDYQIHFSDWKSKMNCTNYLVILLLKILMIIYF